MKIKNLIFAACIALSLASCNREPRMYKGGVDYICFASKTQTVEVTPTTTVANIDIQVEWNDDQNFFKEKNCNISV